jgi:hypothetical protein
MTTPNKVLDQPAYNSNVNTWGTGPLNTNFGYIDLALGGSTLLNSTGLGGTTVALSAAQCIPLSLVISGTPGGITTYTIPAGTGGQWVVRNGTSGGYGVRVQSAAGGTYVTVNAGDNIQMSCDGTSSGMVRNDTTAAAGGSTTQVQYNNAGVLAGSANMTFNGTILTAHTLDASTGGVVFPDNTTQTTAAAVGGSNTQVQFNDGGVFAGDAGLVFNKTTNDLTVGGLLTAAGATLSSTLTMSGAAINGTKAAVASASTTAIGAAGANNIDISGTTTINAFDSIAFGATRTVVFSGSLTLVHSGVLVLPNGGNNIQTQAGDTAIFISSGGGNWKCYAYQRASGQPVAANPVYVTMKAIAAFPFSFSYTPLRSTSILTVEVDIPSIGGQNTNNTLTVTVNAATLNTAYAQYTNVAYHANSFRVIGVYQVASGAALTIGSTLTGGGALVPGGTVYMRVTESDGAIS